jgi:hypothetical protein
MPRYMGDYPRYRASETAYRSRLIIFLSLLSLAFPFALYHVAAGSRHDAAQGSADEAVPVAVGFDLGQSYA